MADNEEGEESIPHVNEYEVPKTAEHEEGAHGNDWEVLSLSASAYAAAPGPKGDESIREDTDSTIIENEEAETSQALFMSRHFAFPPSQHENLPIVPDKIELPKGDQVDDLGSEMNVPREGQFEDNIGDVAKEIPGISLSEEKGHMTFSTHSPELNVDDKERDLYGAAKHDSFDSASGLSGSAEYDGSAIVNDLVESSESVIESGNDDETDDFKLPCGTWWKRGVASLYAHAKETSTFWSIFVAAAVMGLVVLGQRWQQERWQVLHQRWQLSIGDEVL
ncbi:hypothetical protein RND81_03G211800 [Saponaria officinalis]|uniref:ATG8-interacting protein 1 n=1 Tax=Saponaria officinalis TaxID=3572 RepID=A0AAW1M8Z9_SAPOF